MLPLGSHPCARDLLPHLESLPHFLTVLESGKPMPARSKVLGNRTIGGEKPLGVPWGLKPLHASLALACRLVGIFRAVVQIAVLAMFHPRQDLALRGGIALQLIRDDHPRHVGQAFEQLAEELLRGLLVPATLDENVQHVAVLIHSTPQVMPDTIDGEKHLVQVPFIPWPRSPAPELIGIGLSEFPALLPYCFVGDDDSAGEQQLFHIPVAQAKAEVEPHTVADNLGWESMTLIRVGGGWSVHAVSVAHETAAGQVGRLT
jgi:hypothetical protein